MKAIYHYTSFIHFEKILQDGYLKVSDADKQFGVKPAIWFSKNELWEPTATKMVFDGSMFKRLTRDEQLNSIGMVRFGIGFTNEFVSWKKYKHVGKISPQLHGAMEQKGIEMEGNPDDWYCLFRKIPLTECICIEIYEGSYWQSIFANGDDHPSVLKAWEKG